MTSRKTRAIVDEANEIAREVQELLHGRGPEVQGTVLIELMAIFICGHHPGLREEQLQLLITAIRDLVAGTEKQIVSHLDLPEGWSKQ